MLNVFVRRPEWFLGVDASLELLAAIITFFVAFASYKVYRMTSGRKYFYFSASFALLTLGFLTRAVTDFILEELLITVPEPYTGALFFGGYVTHIFLTLAAYLVLIKITFNIKDKKLMALLALILVPGLLLSGSYYISFYGLSMIMLAFITSTYWTNYRKVCKGSACMVFTAFLLLTTSQALFLLDMLNVNLYVAAHIAQAAAFLTLLATLIKTLK